MAITDILTNPNLTKLRTAYKANIDEMAAVLAGVGLQYPPVQTWLDSIGNTVFTELFPPAPPGLPLTAVDRERCLIALIAARHETLNLAVHLYMGLMNEMSPSEVANVLALTGVYTGISAYIRGVKVAGTTFTVLEKVVAPSPIHGPAAAVQALSVAFATWGG